jgi:hypothetical protein
MHNKLSCFKKMLRWVKASWCWRDVVRARENEETYNYAFGHGPSPAVKSWLKEQSFQCNK